MKIANSPLFSLCDQNVEIVTHLLFSCIEDHKLFETAFPELTKKIIYLGWFEDHAHNILINPKIPLYKQFIYNRRAGSKINITGLKQFLKCHQCRKSYFEQEKQGRCPP